MAYTPYNYGGYPAPNYYAPPMPDQLAQLRQNQYNPMMQQQPMQTAPAMQQMPQQNPVGSSSSIIWVSSDKEAVEYPVAPNSAVALWNSNSPVVYLKQTDASGKPNTEIYDLVKRDAQQPVQAQQTPQVEYVTVDAFNALVARNEALTARYEAIAAELDALKSTRTKKQPVKEEE